MYNLQYFAQITYENTMNIINEGQNLLCKFLQNSYDEECELYEEPIEYVSWSDFE